ncbi:MAG: hypothetical protein F6K10_15815 [Moorea sp. SIO2B7]|nr:hypothetical protein [Moorena sp. SIO2B7]
MCTLGFEEKYNEVSKQDKKRGESMSYLQINLFKKMWKSPELTYKEMAKMNGIRSTEGTLRIYRVYIIKTISAITGKKANKFNFKNIVTDFIKDPVNSNDVNNLRGIATRDESIMDILTDENLKNITRESEQTGKTQVEIINDSLNRRYKK